MNDRPPTSSNAAEAAPRTNRVAMTGLGLALLSIPLIQFGIVALTAAIVSAIGLRRARALNGRGRVAGWIGLVIGLAVFVAAIVRYWVIRP